MRMKAIATFVTASFILPLAGSASAADIMAGHMIAAPELPVTLTGEYAVQLNKTQILYLPEAASAVVVGNPDIADVSVHSADTLFVVGRGFGETNIIVLNKAGHTIMNSSVLVSGSKSHNNVRVFNGGSTVRATYSCAPYCQPSPVLGDDTTFISANGTRAQAITSTFATGATAARSQIAGSATEINPPAPAEARPTSMGSGRNN